MNHEASTEKFTFEEYKTFLEINKETNRVHIE